MPATGGGWDGGCEWDVNEWKVGDVRVEGLGGGA